MSETTLGMESGSTAEATTIGRELRNLYVAGPHTQALWEACDDVLTATENLTFLRELARGNLDARVFANYLIQDEIYLDGYARAMLLLGHRAADNEDMRFWAQSASTAVAVEQAMHESLLADERFAAHLPGLMGADGQRVASPTALGYVSFMVATVATQPYEVGVAGVLPCFWVYAHVGKVLTRLVGQSLASNPYRVWIEEYDSQEFDQVTRTAVEILERELAAARESERARMASVFRQACMYELHFWASAKRVERFELAE